MGRHFAVADLDDVDGPDVEALVRGRDAQDLTLMGTRLLAAGCSRGEIEIVPHTGSYPRRVVGRPVKEVGSGATREGMNQGD
jgi:hypothetical protein